MTYPLGWSVITRLIIKRERWPGGSMVRGVPLVYPGQEVVPDQPVLSLEHEEQDRDSEREGEGRRPPSPSSPSLSLSPTSASVTKPGVNVPAGLRGRIVGFTDRGGVVIESQVAVVQGIMGAGSQVAGVLTMWQPGDSQAGETPSIPPGAILVVPGQLSFMLLRQAINSGVVGIVASSIALPDLEGFLRTDYLQLLNAEDVERAQETLPPLTLLFTEGIGSSMMPAQTISLLRKYQGSIVLLSGVTSVRHALSPELIISLPLSETQHNWQPVQPDTTLALGTQVRVMAGEYEGTIGLIDYFFVYEQRFRSGIRARAVRLRLGESSMIVAPIVLVERIW